jgi:alkylation response protein AidB-like acyl-CoA dehydrogenase
LSENFSLGEDQRAVRDLVRRIAVERVAKRADEIDRSTEYPQDMFYLLRELGLLTLPFPPEYGGSNSLLSSCVTIEELGRVCYNTAYLLLVQWSPIGGIIAGGTVEQKQRLLPGLANGTLRAGFSLTEPQSGSDVSGIRTRAKRDGRDIVSAATRSGAPTQRCPTSSSLRPAAAGRSAARSISSSSIAA